MLAFAGDIILCVGAEEGYRVFMLFWVGFAVMLSPWWYFNAESQWVSVLHLELLEHLCRGPAAE